MQNTNFNITPGHVYGYTRVSTHRQATEKNGLDYQYDLCENYSKNVIKKNIFEFHTDVGSSYNNEFALKNLTKLVKNMPTNSLILVSETSRLGRNTFQVFRLLREIINKKSYVISIAENLCFNKTRLMNKQFYQKIIEAEKDSDLISIRVTNALSSIRARGGHIGMAPYGYSKQRVNGLMILVSNDNEKKIIKKLIEKFNVVKNYFDVTCYLLKNKIMKRNKYWSTSAVKDILTKFYPGHQQKLVARSKLTINLEDDEVMNNSNKNNIIIAEEEMDVDVVRRSKRLKTKEDSHLMICDDNDNYDLDNFIDMSIN
jgi:DNA invertase Pin-like site-specific DNA recombinase